MGRIICLLGKSGTGKDTLFHMALSTGTLAPLVPYTTRPRRAHEIDGVTYHFVSCEKMKEMEAAGLVVERRTYQTVHGPWHYFTAAAELDDSTDYLLITTPAALPAIAAYFGQERVVAVLLEAGDFTRLDRSMRREAGQPQPNYAEVCRRYLADEEDFSKPFHQSISQRGYIDADHSPEDCLVQLLRIIELSRPEQQKRLKPQQH